VAIGHHVRVADGSSGAQLLVIRHGQTEWSKVGKHTGRTDIPLTARGRDEARHAARTLAGWNLARAFSSPLARARETAEIVSPACGITIDDDLVEWDYGDFEGLTTPQTREHVPGWSVWTHPVTGGESFDEVGMRADRFLRRFEAEVPGGNAVAFAHGHFLAILIARWCGLAPVEGRRFALATATVTLLGWHREDRVIRALNHRVGRILDPPFRT
jgi:probable phosphoglycerate mutase